LREFEVRQTVGRAPPEVFVVCGSPIDIRYWQG